MSHLDHIVKLKQELIGAEVMNPQSQIDIVRTTYVKALVSVASSNKMSENDRIEFSKYILSYWNETTPVAGHVVMTFVGQFFRTLESKLNGVLTDNELVVEVAPQVEDVKFKYSELDSYKTLIQTLIDEANKKLPSFLETSRIV